MFVFRFLKVVLWPIIKVLFAYLDFSSSKCRPWDKNLMWVSSLHIEQTAVKDWQVKTVETQWATFISELLTDPTNWRIRQRSSPLVLLLTLKQKNLEDSNTSGDLRLDCCYGFMSCSCILMGTEQSRRSRASWECGKWWEIILTIVNREMSPR